MLLHFRYLILVLLQDVFDENKSSFRKWLFDILFKLFILKKNPKLMVYQMTGIATGSLFLVSFSFSATFIFAKTTSTVFQTRNLDLALTLSCHNWFCLDTIVTLMHFSIHEPAFFQRPLITDKNALNSWTYIEVFCISLSMSVTMWA